MFAETNVQLFEPNVLYIKEKPLKIVKNKSNPLKKARTKMLAKRKKVVTKAPPTPAAKVKKSKASPPDVLTVKEELDKEFEESSGYDPLYTSNVEIKMECEAEDIRLEVDKKPVAHYYTNDDTVDTDDKYDSSAGDDADYGAKRERGFADEEEAENDEDSNDEEEDEPLIMLAKRRGRPRKHPRKEVGKVKVPRAVICRETCQQHCPQKFSEAQRLRIHDYFWSLSKEHRVDYIRKHILAKRYKRLNRKKPPSRDNNCYFLHDNDGTESEQMKRVCRKYFESTLRATNHCIQKALKGYKPEPVPAIKPLTEQEREERQNAFSKRAKEIRQVLDPETGNLVTIDPNAKKVKTPDTAPKKKRARRKPGDPMPEHFPKPVKCELRCIFKCHKQFTEEERKQICDLFWSLDYKRRKDFVLTRIETKEVETQVAPEFRKSNRPPRAIQTRCFLRSAINGENKRVCKHFMMATLCISHDFIQNALEFADKTTGYYTGADRRGHKTAPNKIKPECKQIILDHISSYPIWVPNKKSKTRYLHYKLNIKQMHTDYMNMCIEQHKEFVTTHCYYKSFHEDFRLSFLCNPGPKRGRGFYHLNPNISHYTGDEPGGFWMDPKGEKLNTSSSIIDLTQNFMRFPRCVEEQEPLPASTTATGDDSLCTTSSSPTQVTASSTLTSSFSLNQPINYAHFMDPSALAVINAGGMCQQSSTVVRPDFNLNLYDSSLVQAHSSSSSSAVFRRL